MKLLYGLIAFLMANFSTLTHCRHHMVKAAKPFHPLEILGCVLYVDSEHVETHSGFVDTMTDRSPSGNDLSGAGTSDFRPADEAFPLLPVNGSPTGKAGVKFDVALPVDWSWLENSSPSDMPTGDSGRTVFLVGNYHDSNPSYGSGIAFGSDAADGCFGIGCEDALGGKSKILAQVTNDGSRSNEVDLLGPDIYNTLPDNQGWHVWCATGGGGTVELYHDGQEVLNSPLSKTLNTVDDIITIGRHIDQGANYTKLIFGAAIIYNRKLSDTQRGLVEDYLMEYYILQTTSEDDMESNTDPMVSYGEQMRGAP